ncbi:MAG: DnaJ C-terminal domain-containing protein [Thermoguttaceae bacterium]
MTDYYSILGVSKGASDGEIKQAYRKRARELHPDLHPDDPKAKEKFQELQEAFDVLNDTQKRAVYDRYGVNPDRMSQGASGPGGFQWSGGGQSFADFFRSYGGGRGGEEAVPEDIASILGGMFGGGMGGARTAGGRGRRPAPPTRGSDINQSVAIPLSLAVRGGSVDVRLERRGGVQNVSVKIPAGVESGKKIRLRGQGEPSATGGPAGDAILTIDVTEHPHYRRVGNDLHLRLPVSLREAVLGGTVEIATPRGTVSLKIPPQSTSGTKLRLKGHGATTSGDMIVEIEVALPKEWTQNDVEAIRNFTTPEPTLRQDIRWET